MELGQVIGRYRLVGELGRGGMGVVYEGEHVELGCRVAIKLMDVPGASHSARVRRFLREARAAARTRHLHAVNVIDIGVHEQQWFIVMELLKGETLAALIAREGPLLANRIAELVLPVIAAVAAAHDVGVLHRDLKPANIVLAHRGGHIIHPVVTDFGVSKISNEIATEGLTGSHALLGTLHYMAPELTRAASDATAQSDQYSIGVILYECATGHRPFQGAGPYELMHAIVTGKAARPRSINGDVDPRLEAIILRAIDPDPNRRYRSVRELGAAILALANAKTWATWSSEFATSSGPPSITRSDILDIEDFSLSRISASTSHKRSGRVRTLFISVIATGLAVFSLGRSAPTQARRGEPLAQNAVVVSSLAPSASVAQRAVEPTLTPSSAANKLDESALFDPPNAAQSTTDRDAPARMRVQGRKIAVGKREFGTGAEPSNVPQPRLEHSIDLSRERPLEYGNNDAPILE